MEWGQQGLRGGSFTPRKREMEKMKIKKIKLEGSVSWVTNHTVGSMQWCSQSLPRRKRRRGGCEAGGELCGGIWELDGIGEFKDEEWPQGASREEQKTARSVWCA